MKEVREKKSRHRDKKGVKVTYKAVGVQSRHRRQKKRG